MKNYLGKKFSVILVVLVTIVITIIGVRINSPNAYGVYINDNLIAYVESKDYFYTIYNGYINGLNKRFDENLHCNINFKKERIDKSIINSKNSIEIGIKNNIHKKVKALSIHLDKELLGVVANKEEANNILKNVNKKFNTNVYSKIRLREINCKLTQVNNIKDIEKKIYCSKKIKDIILKDKNKIVATNNISRGGNLCTFIYPVQGRITSPFGKRWGRMHKGIDIGANIGTPILAAYSGKVIFSGWQDGYGNVIKIRHSDNFITVYGHCSKLLKSSGDTIKRGETIALVGSTGRSTGPHVHFEIRINGIAKNPLMYLNK